MSNQREHAKELKESLEALKEDERLLQLALRGTQDFVDEITVSCLLRLADYLNQHVNDVWVLCRRYL